MAIVPADAPPEAPATPITFVVAQETERPPILPEGAVWARSISMMLHPLYSTPSLRVRSDHIGQWWGGRPARQEDVMMVLQERNARLLQIAESPVTEYPHNATMDGFVWKTHIPGVMTSYDEIMGHVERLIPHGALVLDAGLGAGLMSLRIARRPDVRVIMSGFGSTDVLGLINAARSGHEVVVLPVGFTPSDTLDTLTKTIRERGGGEHGPRMHFHPYDMDRTPPAWLQADVIFSDHAVVYTTDQSIFRHRITHLLSCLNPGGRLVVTQLNHDATREIDMGQKKKEGIRIAKTLGHTLLRTVGNILRLRPDLAAKSLSGFQRTYRSIQGVRGAMKVKMPLQEMQLPVAQTREILSEFGDVVEHPIQGGFNVMFVVTPHTV